MSGLTNHRGDAWGQDRLPVRPPGHRRGASRTRPLVGLRLCCDELAPWAGITPTWRRRSPRLSSMRASTTSSSCAVRSTPPNRHGPTSTSRPASTSTFAGRSRPHYRTRRCSCRDRSSTGAQAEWAIDDGVCDGVEMTRAQIADPDLVGKLRADAAGTIRPCIRCNQKCQVRDARNPIVSCVGEPSAGRETEDPDWYVRRLRRAASSWSAAAWPGWRPPGSPHSADTESRSSSKPRQVGGMAALAGPGAPLTAWLEAQCRRAGVEINTGTHGDARGGCHHPVHGIATGSARLRDRRDVDGHRCRRRVSRNIHFPTAASHCSTRSVGRSLWRWPRNSASGRS